MTEMLRKENDIQSKKIQRTEPKKSIVLANAILIIHSEWLYNMYPLYNGKIVASNFFFSQFDSIFRLHTILHIKSGGKKNE